MSTQWVQVAAVAAGLILGGPGLNAAPTSQTNSETFTWSGELVSVDTTAKTMTVKSRVAYREAISELKRFRAGERVWIVWSGLHNYSDAVRQIRRYEPNRKIDEILVLPAELVSTEAPDQRITIRVRLPESALAALKAVQPGEWVTVTSRHRAWTDEDAVIAVRPYGATTTTN